MRKPAGVVARWITCGGLSAALDQTRVEYLADDDTDPASSSPRFLRDRLNAGSHQVMALTVALLLARLPKRGAETVCILGGGGLALPLALLAQEPALKVQVVELETDAIELAKEYFGAKHEPRLSLVAGDALEFVISKQVWPNTLSLAIDIDFLRGCPPPPLFLSAEFWCSAWEAVGLGIPDATAGIISLNAIGADEEGLNAVASTALRHAHSRSLKEVDRKVELAAAVLEPQGDKVRSTWTAFVPRPSILLIGPRDLLGMLDEGHSSSSSSVSSSVSSLETALSKAPWAKSLSGPFLRDLEQGSGLLARFRWLEATDPK